MENKWNAIDIKFAVLFDGENNDGKDVDDHVRDVYGSWRIPSFPDRPYVYSNFVMSHDGRISFNSPGIVGGGPISLFNKHDQWLMALLRARADAVMVGANTLRSEPEHLWTADMICPLDADSFTKLRRSEGRDEQPLQVFVSHDGEIRTDAAVFKDSTLKVVIATPKNGIKRAHELTSGMPRVDVIENGEEMVDLKSFLQYLRKEHGVENLLCEGGPQLYGSLMNAGLVDDEFLTVSPIVIGNSANSPQRPGIVEGFAFMPETTPKCRIIGLRKAGEHLFLHSRFRD